MRLRFPEGMRSLVDADLSAQGMVDGVTVSGTVTVRNALYTRGFDEQGGAFDLTTGAGIESSAIAGPGLAGHHRAPAPLRRAHSRAVDARDQEQRRAHHRERRPAAARHLRSAAAVRTCRGRTGRVHLRGAALPDHARDDRLQQPHADSAVLRHRDRDARSRPRPDLPGRRARRRDARSADAGLRSRPAAPGGRGAQPAVRATWRRGRTSSSASTAPNITPQQQLLRERATRALTGALSSEVGRLAEQTFGVDTFQLTPSLVDPNAQSSRLDPAARLTIGKRLSERIYLTYSRSLSSSTRDQIILLEYDQTDRFSWILSRNEDRTYALDVRVQTRVLTTCTDLDRVIRSSRCTNASARYLAGFCLHFACGILHFSSTASAQTAPLIAEVLIEQEGRRRHRSPRVQPRSRRPSASRCRCATSARPSPT